MRDRDVRREKDATDRKQNKGELEEAAREMLTIW